MSFGDHKATSNGFASRTYALKAFAGDNSLSALPEELRRNDVRRALILCGKSVHEQSGLTQRIANLLGDRMAGIFPGISEGAPSHCIEEAARIGTEIEADGLIAIGAGSVIKGTRVVAMLMAEKQPLEAMATRHVEGQPPITQKLLAPKVPIFNVLTSPTSAQNRGGSAVRHHGEVHHLEFFDPKTRPRAVFWDSDALASAPLSLARSTSFETYWWALMCIGAAATSNPLVQASRYQAWKLARSAYRRLGQPGDAAARIDLCAASLLQNRDEEDGGRPISCHILIRATYAIAVAMFNRYPKLTQSHGYAGMAPAVITRLGHLCPDVTANIGVALGLQTTPEELGLTDRVAAAVKADFEAIGWRCPLKHAGITEGDVPEILHFALRNFNANYDGLLHQHVDALHDAITLALTAS